MDSRPYSFGLVVLFLSIVTWITQLSFQQSIAIIIIGSLITGTFLYWNRRLSFGFIGVAVLLAVGILRVEQLIEFGNIDIIVFLIGMMVFVGFIERAHFFEFYIGKLIKKIGHRPKLLIVSLLVIAAVLAALVDEVTSILIMTAIIFHITSEYKVNPIPFILMTVFATNIGSSATVVGNPVGVLIALKGSLTFADFLRWATPISVVTLIASIAIMFVLFRKDIANFSENIKESPVLKEDELIANGDRLTATILFIFTLLGLIFHSQLEQFLGLEKNTMLIGVALISAGIALILSRERAGELIERRVDWWTLMFFMFLFASVGSLETTGFIQIFSNSLEQFTGGNIIITIITVMVVGGILSAILDNVLAVAIMIPVIENIIVANPTLNPVLWWALLFAGTLFGNLTFIGSTANLVALGVLTKRGYPKISFLEWFKPGFVIVLITFIIALALILLQMPFMVIT